MTDNVSTLGLAVDSRQVRTAAGDLDKLSAAGKRSENSAAGLTAGFGAFKSVLGGLSLLAVTREALQQADAYASMSARLALVTSGTQNLATVQGQLFDLSQRTRVGLDQTTDLFASLSRSTKSLGVSQKEVIGVTETINKALIISGTSATSAAAALVQLSQGFASGTLRGDELNSILEQTPRLAEAIAQGLGVSRGALRALGAEGALTAEKVFQALQRSANAIDDEFARMPTTVGQAITQINNSIFKLVGELDKVSGTSPAISSWAQKFSASLDTLSVSLARTGSLWDSLLENREMAAASASARRYSSELGRVVDEFIRLETLNKDGKATLAQQARIRELRDEIVDLQKSSTAAATTLKDLANKSTMPTSMGRTGDDPRRLDTGNSDLAVLTRNQEAIERFRKDYATASERFNAELKKQRDEAGTLFTAEDEQRLLDKFFPKAGQDSKQYETEIQSIRERLALLGQETELERTRAMIRAGAYKGESEQQLTQRQSLAVEIDQANALVKLKQDEERAREAVTASITRSAMASLKEVDDLDKGNTALKKEIELMGTSEQAQAKIEQAYISSTIARKEDQIAALEAQGTDEKQLQVLESEIALLKERQSLLGQKADKKDSIDAQEEAKKTMDEITKQAERASADIQDAFGDSIKMALDGDFGDIADMWESMLKSMAAKAIAAQLSQYLLGDSSTGGTASGLSDIVNLMVNGFASGGDHKGGLRIVGEKGPELEATGASRIYSASQTAQILSQSSASTGANVKVEINNQGSAVTATQSTTTQSDGTVLVKLLLKAVADDMSTGGVTARAIKQRFTQLK